MRKKLLLNATIMFVIILFLILFLNRYFSILTYLSDLLNISILKDIGNLEFPLIYEVMVGIVVFLFVELFKKLSIYKNIMLRYEIKKFQWSNIDVEGHRKFRWKNQDSIPLTKWYLITEKTIKKLDLMWDGEKLGLDEETDRYAKNYSLLSAKNKVINARISPIIPSSEPADEIPRVSGCDISLKLKSNWKDLDEVINLLEKNIRVYGQFLTQSISSVKWEPPKLEISPATPFIKNSYWLQEKSEGSSINIILKDKTRITLSKEKIVIRDSTEKEAIAKGFDERFTMHLKSAIVTFYESRVASNNS